MESIINQLNNHFNSLSLDKMKETMNEVQKHMEFHYHLKKYMDSVSDQQRDMLIKQLYAKMSLDAKIQIYNDLSKENTIDYVIFNYQYECALMNEKSLDTIYKNFSKDLEDDCFEILYICQGEKHYFNCHIEYPISDELNGNKYITHPEADILCRKLRKTLPYYSGVVVKCIDTRAELVNIDTYNFTKAVMKCEHCYGLSTQPCQINYYKININNEMKTVLYLKYDTECG